jgi:hypothetical protein
MSNGDITPTLRLALRAVQIGEQEILCTCGTPTSSNRQYAECDCIPAPHQLPQAQPLRRWKRCEKSIEPTSSRCPLKTSTSTSVVKSSAKKMHSFTRSSANTGVISYGLNGAFAALLRALGFQVTLLSARVARSEFFLYFPLLREHVGQR